MWWRDAVIYQVYPRSFQDTDGDGVGDLRGIEGRLDHVAALGADAVWLSPIYPSPLADLGYDVAEFRDVDPVFGTLEHFDALLAAAHERGLRLLMDLVPCLLERECEVPLHRQSLAKPRASASRFYGNGRARVATSSSRHGKSGFARRIDATYLENDGP